MRTAIRCDASPEIGLGHLMRTLVLADALVETGHDCVFLMRSSAAMYAERIEAAGHAIVAVSSETDAVDRVASGMYRCVVLDTYSNDRDEWNAVQGRPKIVVLDDLADEVPAYADLAVNPSPSRTRRHREAPSQMLRGPAYALVHRAFHHERRSSLPHRPARSVAVVMGGTDSSDMLGSLADGVVGVSEAVHVCGSTSEQVTPGDGVVNHGFLEPAELARLLAGVDLVVSSASTLTWEVCTLRTPAVFVQTADNQRGIAEWIRSTDVAPLGKSVEDVVGAVARVADDVPALRSIAERMGHVTDGLGAVRVARAIDALFVDS